MTSALYDFVWRGLLTEEALDGAGRQGRHLVDQPLTAITEALNFDLLDPDEVDASSRMAAVHLAITAFERSARRFVKKILQAGNGETWWEDCVSQKIRDFAAKRQDEENKVKWHGTRGDDPLTYTEMGQLVDIINQNWELFEPHVHRQDWATSIFSTIERSRNVIMHSGTLDIEDIERLGMNIRDWVKQVGS